MHTDKMREEFEAWYLAEYYEGDQQCGLEWLSTEPCGVYRYAEPARAWRIWQASRAALVVELPSDPNEEFSDRRAAVYACRAAIEAAGVTVRGE